ncbi:hypothetical protein [Aneurinibacillus terranovensis]|uniref:hypothetical protein n=1 Tax=Aneurinibacillus terranovensis TaxID=278991 RepID=UPI001B7F9612
MKVLQHLKTAGFKKQFGFSYSYLYSWFTHAPLVKEVVERGLHTIGMVKADNKR